ncbi:fkbH domain protein [Rhodococcus sp. MTM3W5.2]|nr:fkbH domain protein [Rhodococcus sp. MTM3W5.2]
MLEDADVTLADSVVEVIAALDARGILHSIASKNDHDLAWSRLEKLGIAQYFVFPQIGWGPKSASVRNIAEQLNFAHTAIAFIDDQPAERAEVNFHLPQVRCYPHDSIATLPTLSEFSPRTVTVDSRRRRQMYQAGFSRNAERAAFAGPDEAFLRSLELELQILRADALEISRVEELTLRTSQMNATGVHYSARTLRELCADTGHEVLVASLTDRFGPHGAIGVLLLEKLPERWHLKLLATSCRVVSLGAGAAILNWLTDQAARADVHLVADFRATERNRMMEIAYRFAGFTDAECGCLPADATTAGLQRLHMVPERRPVPDVMRIDAVDLVTAA